MVPRQVSECDPNRASLSEGWFAVKRLPAQGRTFPSPRYGQKRCRSPTVAIKEWSSPSAAVQERGG
jgi:hypothetical protein